MQRLGKADGLIAGLALVVALPGCSLTNGLDDVLCSRDEEDCGSAQASGGAGMAGSGAGPTETGGAPNSGGGGTGGAGSGGNAPEGGAPPLVSCPEPGDLELLYQNGEYQEADTLSSRIRPHFQIRNQTDESVPWSSLQIRYYFTADDAEGLGYECIYGFGVNGCHGAVSGKIASTAGADKPSVLTVTFGEAAGNVPPLMTGASFKGAILHATGPDFEQENDYSYSDDPTYERDYAEWDHVTLHCGDVLLDGTPPSE